ncbi:MAG: DUF2933 domain-containing protein [Deltaproteobacteria bacterium]|nr:DUF2933 domain-containing protein [Deltaproteobacteria bacterium]
MTSHQQQEHSPSRLRSNIALLVFLGIAGFYLLTEHTAHLFGVLPYLLLLLILVAMYVRLARMEEHDAFAEFGEAYARYAATTPAFFPQLSRTEPRGA